MPFFQPLKLLFIADHIKHAYFSSAAIIQLQKALRINKEKEKE